MELTQEKTSLLERLIRSDEKFANNEDLYEDFFNETYKRSFLIVSSVNDMNALEAYLRKIVTTSIIMVLKNSGRVMRAGNNYVSVREIPLETSAPKNSDFDELYNKSAEISQVQEPTFPVNRFADAKVVYNIVDPADGPEEIFVKKDILQRVVDAVTTAHCADVSKQYLPLYNLRYVEGLNQNDIAQSLNLSQSEVSKRLFELMEAVKKALNE